MGSVDALIFVASTSESDGAASRVSAASRVRRRHTMRVKQEAYVITRAGISNQIGAVPYALA